ncbi:MAG: purine-nucleoside phosphorylase [Polyangia bacterium]|jgi:purine-nucleoside phosphorylase
MKIAASLHDQVQAAAEAIALHLDADATDVVVVLGSGLAAVGDRLPEARSVPYAALPGLPEPTVAGHPGRLLCGQWAKKKVLIFCGRVHGYEGYPATELAIPIRAAATLGAQTAVITNVAGAINPALAVGQIVAIRDHINLTGTSPLTGPNDERLGPRFLDMGEPYLPALLRLASAVAEDRFGAALAEGVYASLPGPSYETPAEVAMLRVLGADLVGMSTVHEVIAARHSGLAVMGLSLVANHAAGLAKAKLSHEQVTHAAAVGAARMGELIEGLVTRLPSEASDA